MSLNALVITAGLLIAVIDAEESQDDNSALQIFFSLDSARERRRFPIPGPNPRPQSPAKQMHIHPKRRMLVMNY
jgi:hypothetical protein